MQPRTLFATCVVAVLGCANSRAAGPPASSELTPEPRGDLIANSHPVDSTLSPDSSADTVLDVLNLRGKPPLEFVAKLADREGDINLGNTKTHTGTIWFSRPSETNLRVHVLFDKVIDNHLIREQKREYLLNGEWLTDRNYDAKTEGKHQVMRPGEKRDLMKLGDGPFPLPIGQDKEDVKKQFDVVKGAPAKDDPPQTIHLTLTPKPNTELAKKFTSIDIWVDQKSHMPIVIDTLSGDSEHRVELKDIQVNPTTPLGDKDFTLPPVDNSWNLTTDSYGK